MTNAQIILEQSILLLKEGKIKSTGRTFVVELEDGSKAEYQEPEAIHTYQGWKERGYQVQKGEHAVAQFPVWKYATKKAEDDDQPDSRMFLKTASFFSQSQVKAIEPEG